MTTVDLGPRYHSIRPLGSGGLGRVFLVRDRHLELDLALKLLRKRLLDEEDVRRFRDEFTLLTGLRHPGIARAYDFGYLEDQPYFTMEYVPGEPLHAGSLLGEPRRLLAVGRGLAEALSFLHRGGILHLDLKPANTMVVGGGQGSRVVLIDFGLYRRALPSLAGTKIQGSLPYMAPEYFQGERLGPATDVYAFGVTLYRVATGEFPRPVSSRSGSPVDWSLLPAPPSRWCSGIHPELEQILLRCLAVDPASRFTDAMELAKTLARLPREGGGPAEVFTTPLTVGRHTELGRIESFLESLLPRTGRPGAASEEGLPQPPVLFLTGRSGIGQTHLLREAKVRAQTLGIPFYLETGYAGREVPPGSLLRCLEAHLATPGARSRWRGFLSRLGRARRAPRVETSEGERHLRRAGEVALAARSVAEPLILALDGLQHRDEVSVELVADLVRFLGEEPAGSRPPLRLLLGFREEGRCATILRELSSYLLRSGRAFTLTLRPLDVTETAQLYRHHDTAARERFDELVVFQETQGIPARIIALARAGSASPDPQSSSSSLPPARPRPAKLEPAERRVLGMLSILERPALSSELSRLLRIPASTMRAVLERLLRQRYVETLQDVAGRKTWLLAGAPAMSGVEIPEAEKVRLHRRVADGLLEQARGPEDPGFLEAVHHLRSGRRKAAFVEHGLAAARHLKATFQNRAALELYRHVLEALPKNRTRACLDTVLELAELPARLGEIDEGIRVLREFYHRPGKVPRVDRARILLRLAVLHGRRGDFRRAAALFTEGFELGRDRLDRAERLFFLNEHAALKVVVGENTEARRLCDDGLRIARRSRSSRIREIALNLYATRANAALRDFDYEGAIRDHETALDQAEARASPAYQAAILNNLGIVLSNCDRYGEAIQAFREAERLSLRLEEGPSLVSIYGNLAILSSKTGDISQAGDFLSRAEGLGPRAVGRRQELFLKHARALVLVGQGRYSDARVALDEAIELGRLTGDRFVTAFDEVYRAEAGVFCGDYGAAQKELLRLGSESSPVKVRRMALARLAYLHALTGCAEELLAVRRRYYVVQEERPVPSVDAWNELFLGWACSIGSSEVPASGRARTRASALHRQSEQHLDAAESFFLRHGLRPATSLTSWIRAEHGFLKGDTEGALRCLQSQDPGKHDLASALVPLLEARLLLEESPGSGDRARAGDLLSRAGSGLIANALPEWLERVAVLRARLDSGGGKTIHDVNGSRHARVRGLPKRARRLYARSGYWRRWTQVKVPAGKPLSAGRAGRAPKDESTTTSGTSRTRPLGAQEARVSRRGLVVRSPAMRRVDSMLDKLASSSLPVLIEGEIGTGKELVARIIHQESRRSAGPFLVLDGSTVPGGLIESELFGARAGAFTDLERDRAGLIAMAQGGTLLVDRIEGAPAELQSKLLRVLSEGSFRRLGDEVETPVDVRFLFSTSSDLEVEVREGRFRADLLHRIRVLFLRMPPLRERREDLEDLVTLFLEEGTGKPPRVDKAAYQRLRGLPWPGNVRELRNAVLRLRFECPEPITASDVERVLGGHSEASGFSRELLDGDSLEELQDGLERAYLLHHLQRLGGDTKALSRSLGISRQQLYRRLRRLGIRLRERRGGRG